VPNNLFAPRRLGVCGSSKDLAPQAVKFCRFAGSELAKNDNIVIMSGGTRKRRSSNPDNLAADWHIVSTARDEIIERCGRDAIDQRIETVVTGDIDSQATEQFQFGKLSRTRGKTSEARRFSFVRSLDGLLAVAGRFGTAQEMALAMELGIPVLPVPLFDGAAKDFWCSYEPDLIRMLQIDAAIADRWRAPVPNDESSLHELAAEMVRALLSALPRRCFVIMPFSDEHVSIYDFVIEPALASVGHSPIRLDRTAVPGDTAYQIHEGIRRCDYVIAVLDGLKPNVLYELGLAHAYGKRTILMNREGSFGQSETPFDLALQQRLQYRLLEASLVDRLKKTIANLPAV
jgi:predicted Rossmann-fold nucleotide-binding protein/nucleoside 2-deoxyribosyltransferase